MGQSRARQQQGQRQLELIAAAILASPTPGALAPSLVGILPLAAFLGGGAAGVAGANRIALIVATVVLADLSDIESAPSPYMRRVFEDQLIWRAAYVRAASRRLAEAYLGGRLEQQQALEDSYFKGHLRRTERRLQKATEVEQAMARFGLVVGWYALVRPTSRPHHRAAHRHNWQPMFGVPLQTGGLPGELEHCLCEVGPPIEGAPILR